MPTFDELLPIGKEFVTPGRTIGEADFIMFANMTWDIGSVHCDKEFMKGTQFGERILAGTCVLAVVEGLAIVGGLREVVYQDKLKVVAVVGFDEVRFTAAVIPGDTLTVHWQIAEVRPSAKNPKRGVLKVKYVALNQHGKQVMTAISPLIVEMTA
jgi:acyl dehydratase